MFVCTTRRNSVHSSAAANRYIQKTLNAMQYEHNQCKISATTSDVLPKIKVGIRCKLCGRGAVGARIEAPKGVRCAPSPENFLAFGSQNGEFWCILGRILQFSCLFTAYANVIPVCVTESDKLNKWSPFQNFTWQTEVLFSRVATSQTLGLYTCIFGAFEELAKLASVPCLLS